MSTSMRSLIAAASLALGLPLAAHASPVTLTFAGLSNGTDVGSTYNNKNGGFATFTNGVVGNEAVQLKLNASSLDIDVANGFNTSITFSFSERDVQTNATVSLYDDQNNVIASQTLFANSSFVGENWEDVTLNFSGKGALLSFTGVAGAFRIDNISFDTQFPTTEVPEPATAALLALALAGVVSTRRRRQR